MELAPDDLHLSAIGRAVGWVEPLKKRLEISVCVLGHSEAALRYARLELLVLQLRDGTGIHLGQRGDRWLDRERRLGGGDELQLDVEADVTQPDARLSATPPVHGALARVAALEVLLVGKVLLGPLFMRIAALEGQPDDPPTNLRDALARLGALESMT